MSIKPSSDPTLLNRFVLPAKGGADLRASFGKPPLPRTPVVSEFLYRRKLTYLVADPGCGKSTIATQLAFSLAAGVPVFGLFDVPAPARVYYVAFETDWDEFQESADIIRAHIPYEPDKVTFDENLLGLDVSNFSHSQVVMKKLTDAKPDLIILDPLYLLIGGDLKEGAIAASAAYWMRNLAVVCDCAVLALHHTHKERLDPSGKPSRVKDRSYGSRWLKASATLFWQMSELAGEDGVFIENLKDRYKLSRKTITLHYDPSSKLSMGKTGGKQYLVDALIRYLDAHKPGEEFTFVAIANVLDCAPNYVYELTKETGIKGRLERVTKPDRTVVWRLTGG